MLKKISVYFIANMSSVFFYCPCCKQHLECPSSTVLAQCPTCNDVISPFDEYELKCIECQSSITYPCSAQIVQCPRSECLCIINVGVQPFVKCEIDEDMKDNEQQSSFSNELKSKSSIDKSSKYQGFKSKISETHSMQNVPRPIPFKNAWEFYISNKLKDREYSNENHWEMEFHSNSMWKQRIRYEWENMSSLEQRKWRELSLLDRKRYALETNEFNQIYNEMQIKCSEKAQ